MSQLIKEHPPIAEVLHQMSSYKDHLLHAKRHMDMAKTPEDQAKARENYHCLVTEKVRMWFFVRRIIDNLNLQIELNGANDDWNNYDPAEDVALTTDQENFSELASLFISGPGISREAQLAQLLPIDQLISTGVNSLTEYQASKVVAWVEVLRTVITNCYSVDLLKVMVVELNKIAVEMMNFRPDQANDAADNEPFPYVEVTTETTEAAYS